MSAQHSMHEQHYQKDETVTTDRAVEASSNNGSLGSVKIRGKVVLVPQPSDDPTDPLVTFLKTNPHGRELTPPRTGHNAKNSRFSLPFV